MKLKLPGFDKLPGLLDRFKYPLAVLLLGLVLLLWPARNPSNIVEAEPVPSSSAQEDDGGEAYRLRMEQRLEALLSQVEGAGRVRVLLTLRTGPSSTYQTDLRTEERPEGEGNSLSREEKTVILSRGSAYDELAAVRTDYPVFQGALVVAEGGADPSVRLQLSAAVAALLDLGADQITVVKMK